MVLILLSKHQPNTQAMQLILLVAINIGNSFLISALGESLALYHVSVLQSSSPSLLPQSLFKGQCYSCLSVSPQNTQTNARSRQTSNTTQHKEDMQIKIDWHLPGHSCTLVCHRSFSCSESWRIGQREKCWRELLRDEYRMGRLHTLYELNLSFDLLMSTFISP